MKRQHVNVSRGRLILTVFLLQVAVAVGVGQPAFLQVPPDAEPGPLHPPLTLEPGLVHRVRQRENALPVVLGSTTAAVGRSRRTGGRSFSLKTMNTGWVNNHLTYIFWYIFIIKMHSDQ